MKKLLMFSFLLVICATLGCGKKPATVQPPTISFAQYANSQLAVAQVTLHDNHVWELCDVKSWPITVTVDGKTELCSTFEKTSYPAKKELADAVGAYNFAEIAYQAYKATANADQSALEGALAHLLSQISMLTAKTGGK
jgi:hypothetical protein